jgi:hypothetical protein
LNSDDNCVRGARRVDHGQSYKARPGRIDQTLTAPSSSPTDEPFGSVNARARQVPLNTAEFGGKAMLRPPTPWSANIERRNGLGDKPDFSYWQ